MKVSQFYLQPPNTWEGGKRKRLSWKTCKHLRNSNFCLQWSNLLTHLVCRKVWKWHHTHYQGPQNSDRVKILELYMGLYPISQLLSQCSCLGRSVFWSTEEADSPPPVLNFSMNVTRGGTATQGIQGVRSSPANTPKATRPPFPEACCEPRRERVNLSRQN